MRSRVVAEALTWLGTPFHDCARVKGAGVDCVNLLIGVYSAVGLIEAFDPEPYSPQWFQHRAESRFLGGLKERARRVEAPKAGDVAMYVFGRHPAHAAILVGDGTIVHAYKPVGRVTRGPLDLPRGPLHSFWSVIP